MSANAANPGVPRPAGCRCGAVRFAARGPIRSMFECHCTDCQKIGGGAASFLTMVNRADVRFLTGQTRFFVTIGQSGRAVFRGYCADCGAPTYSMIEANPNVILIKTGAYDTHPGFRPAYVMWTRSAPSWHIIPPGIPTYPENPI